jgi:hypothetical protein
MAIDSIDRSDGHLQHGPFTAAADLSINFNRAAPHRARPEHPKSKVPGDRPVHNPYRSPPQSRFMPAGYGRTVPLPPSATVAVAPRPRGWWGRNWKWVVPVVGGTPLLVCGGLLTLLFSVGFSAIKKEWYYEQAVARTRASAEVTAILGTPIDAGFPSGSLNRTTSSGHADIKIPISGPDGKGTIYVVAERSKRQWSFSTLKVRTHPTGELFDLME